MKPAPIIRLRRYQAKVFWDHATKTQILHWSRQIGKSFTLANWAVKRLLDHPGRLVTVLSNSRANGQEFVLKCQEVCRAMGRAFESDGNAAALDRDTTLSEDIKYSMMREEVRLTIGGQVSRIIVLAANPRTARGFSGDLVLDEFAFHEDSRAIWEAAEPIISSNPDFLCRISSTGNGKRNMFYELIAAGKLPYCKLSRSEAWASGELKIYSAITGRAITPGEARDEAADKSAYDQNYECLFADEASVLLSRELISLAQREGLCEIDRQAWGDTAIARMARAKGPLHLGQDVARTRDFSVQYVLERDGSTLVTLGILCMEGLRLPEQEAQLRRVCELPNLRRAEIDMTGLGLGLVEYAQERPWGGRVHGVNFSSTEPTTQRIASSGSKRPSAKVTEIMATDLLAAFEDRRIAIPVDPLLRDDLRKPEKLVSPSGQVSIAASRDKATGHADFFWALALAVRAAGSASGPAIAQAVPRSPSPRQRDLSRLLGAGRINRERSVAV
jgi:phage FluMu gp28-like protein